ncbi:hypothetical protein QWZ08_23670 [Ferruginibacter paludis]|uniref:hypothetical protein n=1 Tax=Ferruginibacter paludis TaxID=1310417 RepID=UPI0025B2942F|nr:hypothetical protein [Ferruginibacter paludis]MDN3658663.1 hypothetical protein [Ferruginibacter paludis]
MKLTPVVLLILAVNFFINIVAAQDSSKACKVALMDLAGKYTGDCKNGLANGKGEATGLNHYKGIFRNGLPNGAGVYNYSDSTWYSGNFQDGIKEGKGELHYMRASLPDSILSGFWSGGEYRGRKYITYLLNGTTFFDNVEVIPSKESGHILKIEISTTSGAANVAPPSGNPVLTLASLTAVNAVFANRTSNFATATKSSVSYEISQFPAHFFATLSNGETFNLELYKAANWTVRLYRNQ